MPNKQSTKASAKVSVSGEDFALMLAVASSIKMPESVEISGLVGIKFHDSKVSFTRFFGSMGARISVPTIEEDGIDESSISATVSAKRFVKAAGTVLDSGIPEIVILALTNDGSIIVDNEDGTCKAKVRLDVCEYEMVPEMPPPDGNGVSVTVEEVVENMKYCMDVANNNDRAGSTMLWFMNMYSDGSKSWVESTDGKAYKAADFSMVIDDDFKFKLSPEFCEVLVKILGKTGQSNCVFDRAGNKIHVSVGPVSLVGSQFPVDRMFPIWGKDVDIIGSNDFEVSVERKALTEAVRAGSQLSSKNSTTIAHLSMKPTTGVLTLVFSNKPVETDMLMRKIRGNMTKDNGSCLSVSIDNSLMSQALECMRGEVVEFMSSPRRVVFTCTEDDGTFKLCTIATIVLNNSVKQDSGESDE